MPPEDPSDDNVLDFRTPADNGYSDSASLPEVHQPMSNLESINTASTPVRLDAAVLDRAGSSRPGAVPAAVVRIDADQLELSPEALARGAESPIRQDLVSRIRAELQAGTYDTTERLDRAIDGLAGDLLG